MNFTKFWSKHTLDRFFYLGLIIWVAHFSHFRDLGLYEDDYAFVSPALGWDLSDLLRHGARVFSVWPQGRPLGFFLPQLFSFIGSQLGGVHVIYVIAFLIITLNAFLFYALLKKVTQETIAFIGALIFCIFPADTTHTFLMHALGLQTSITFLLIASHYYLSGKRVLPYVVILGALLIYESPFMVFWGIPLLRSEIKWDHLLKKELVRHIVILAGMMLFVVVIRTFMGEQRVMEMGASALSLVKIPLEIAGGIFIGPVVSLALFLYGPIYTLFHWNSQLSVVFVACLAGFIWILRQLVIDTLDEKSERQIVFGSRVFTYDGIIKIPPSYLGIAKLFLVAVILLGLAYTLSFTHFPPITRAGRGTSVHLAAALGGALMFACICSIALSSANAYRLKNHAIMILALYLSLVITYRFSIQQDFQQAHQNQRSFWTRAIENLPDMTDGTVVFVLEHDLPKTYYIVTNSWADPVMLRQIFLFPDNWENPPRLFVVRNDWTELLIREGNQIKWQVPTATWPSHWEALPNSNVILLEMEHGALVRKFGTISIDGQELELKPLPLDIKPNLKKGPLYNFLIDEAGYQSSR